MDCLKDKVVVITGASSGIGYAAALKFAEKGSSIVLAARRAEKLQELQNKIVQSNPNCIFVPTDLTQPEQVQNLFDRTLQQFKKIDILINNAGRGLRSELSNITPEDFKSVIDTNLTSVFLCTKQAVKIMTEQNIKGHIITVCSIASLFGAPTYSAYCASKHAVNGFVKSLRWELRKHHIKISAIYPARVDTEFFNSYKKRPSKKQLLNPNDIAELLLAVAQRAPLKAAVIRARNFVKRIRNLITPA
jgi:3-oxoacyl-[acyl-carrier protein] reductase